MKESSVGHEVEQYVRHTRMEGWVSFFYRLYHTEDGSFVLHIEHYDVSDQSAAGWQWIIPEDAVDEIRCLVFDLDIHDRDERQWGPDQPV